MGVETHAIEFDLVLDDIQAFRRYYFFESQAGQRRLRWRRVVWFLVLPAPVWASLARLADQGRFLAALAVAVITSVLNGFIAWHLPVWLIKGNLDINSMATRAPGHWRITATSETLAHVHPAGSAAMPWTDFNRVEATASAIYIFKGETAFVVPKRAFEDSGAADEFAAYAERMINRYRRSV